MSNKRGAGSGSGTGSAASAQSVSSVPRASRIPAGRFLVLRRTKFDKRSYFPMLELKPKVEPKTASVGPSKVIPSLDDAADSMSARASHMNRYRSVLASEDASVRRAASTSSPPTPKKESSPLIADDVARPHPLSHSALPSSSFRTPPPSPKQPQQIMDNTSGTSMVEAPTRPTFSPYDPTATPSFRHSSPRRPSDQPWRFPSPSHPLHYRAREITLSQLARDAGSPATKITPLVHSTPADLNSENLWSGTTPLSQLFPHGSKLHRPDSPSSMLQTPGLMKDSPGALFTKGELRSDDSPLTRNIRNYAERSHHADFGFGSYFSPAIRTYDPLKLSSDDLLALQSPWSGYDIRRRNGSPPISQWSSPVQRTCQPPNMKLIDPFLMHEAGASKRSIDDLDDLDDLSDLSSDDSGGDEAEVENTLEHQDALRLSSKHKSVEDIWSDLRPPTKRRKTYSA